MLIIVFAMFLASFGALIFYSPPVQTYLTKRVSAYLSNILKTEISVGIVHLSFGNHYRIGDVCVLDFNKDTLAFFEDLSVEANKSNLLSFNTITFTNPKFFVKTDSVGNTNFDFLADYFSSESDSSQMTENETTSPIFCKNIRVRNGSLRYKNLSVRQLRDSVLTFMPEDMYISDFELNIDNLAFDDSISAEIKNLSFKEKSGLNITESKFNISYSDENIFVDKLLIITDKSTIQSRKIRYSEINKKPFFEMKLDNAYLHTSEIALFEPHFAEADFYINFEAESVYTGNNAVVRNMFLELGESSDLYADINIENLKNLDSLDISAFVQELRMNVSDFKKTLKDFNVEVPIPQELTSLKQMYFSGKVSNRSNESSLIGIFESNLGNFYTDIFYKADSITNTTDIRADFQDATLNLGQISGEPMLGTISFSGKNAIQLKNGDLTEFKSDINCTSLLINGYNYKSINILNNFTKNSFSSDFYVNDQSAKLKGKAEFNTKTEAATLHFDLKYADLNQLNFDKSHDTAIVRAKFDAEFIGRSPDKFDGFAGISDLTYRIPGDSLHVASVILNTEHTRRERVFKLSSDFFEADLRGTFKFNTLEEASKKFLSAYIPVYTESFDPKKLADDKNRILNFTIDFHNMQKINKFFFPENNIGNGAHAEAFFKTDDASLDMLIQIPVLKIGADSLTEIKIETLTDNNALTISANAGYFTKDGSFDLQRIHYEGSISENIMSSALSVQNTDSVVYGGDIFVRTVFDYQQDILKTQSRFEPTQFTIANLPWTISADNLWTDSEHIGIEHFEMLNGTQKITVSGILGQSPNDLLELNVSELDISSLKSFTKNSGIEAHGFLNGTVNVYAAAGTPYFELLGYVNQLNINKQDFGDLSISVSADTAANMSVEALAQNGKNRFTCSGTVSNENIADISLVINTLDLAIAQNFLGKDIILENGHANGFAQIYGNLSDLQWDATLHLREARMNIAYLNTELNFSTIMALNNSMMQISETEISDAESNTATFSAFFKHKNFNNIEFDINFATKKFTALNTSASTVELFYGKLYVAGNAQILGTPDVTNLTARIETLPESELVVKTDINESGDNSKMMSFVEKRSDMLNVVQYQSFTGVNVDMNLLINSETKFKILMSSDGKDAITAQGIGDLHISTNPQGDIEITGDYVIGKGEYQLTLAQVYNMKFGVTPDSKLSWQGDPYNAVLSIAAFYPMRRVRLYDLTLADFAKDVYYPVNCMINMSQSVENPTIKFGVEIGGFGEKYNSKLRNLPESDLNKQFLSLLVLGKFQPLPGLEKESSEFPELNVGQILSGQLGSLISVFSDQVDIDLNYNKNAETHTDEIELDFSTELFNDRVTINGNVAKGDYRNTAGDVVGDFDAEIKLKPEGSVRMKLFNKSNRDISYETAPYTQGIGFFYRKEFNRFFANKSKMDSLK